MNKPLKHPEKLPIGLMILSNAVPPIGFYLSYKYRKEFPGKARTAFMNALIGIPLGLIGGYLVQTCILV
ncbi:hypothetical protein [Fluviicola sp.]|uniref:hypothetical protein n=1 Tax=Fluviicola sp. TaxID=1917219 RepID=UPI0031CF34C2